MKIKDSETDIPHFGRVMISTLICPRCGYRSSDVIPLADLPPGRYSVKVNHRSCLSTRVIRSSTSTIKIPEFGIRIDPGSANEGYITNIEGVLTRILSIIDQMIRDLYAHPHEFENTDERIEKAGFLKDTIEAIIGDDEKLPVEFTMIIEDPSGNSALVSEYEAIFKEDLKEEEIVELMGGLNAG